MKVSKLQFILNEETIENISREHGEENWLKEKRKSAFKEFINLPQEKLEVFKKNTFPFADYLENSRELVETKFEISGIKYSSIFDAVNDGKGNFFGKLKSSDDKMIAFANSFFNSGYFLEVPENFSGRIKISIILPKNSLSVSQNIIVVGENSEVIIDNEFLQNKNSVHVENVLIYAKDNSKIIFERFQDLDVSNKIFINTKFLCGRDVKIISSSQNFGSEFVRNRNQFFLEGDGSTIKDFQIIFGSGRQKFDVNTEIISVGKSTKAETFTKGVFSENSKGVIKGKIEVRKGAKKSDTYLAQHGMLVGKNSEANTIPCLEIIEEDVARATHSASVSKMDEDQLFYLMSRGLSELDAKNLIVFAFLLGNLKNIDEKKKEQISEVIIRKIGESIAS